MDKGEFVAATAGAGAGVLVQKGVKKILPEWKTYVNILGGGAVSVVSIAYGPRYVKEAGGLCGAMMVISEAVELLLGNSQAAFRAPIRRSVGRQVMPTGMPGEVEVTA
ncbi:unnamed protein product [marine sediment metagenome]|uniref:Uncharacterized protein n=1 Tax=marine sediment metagenome TaxID=412755 RepID=X1NPV6_9ZZZZ